MYTWEKQIQIIVDEIDECIRRHDDEALTLHQLSHRLGYSAFYTTRKFKEIAGVPLREYLRQRKLAFALKEVRDSDQTLLSIALDYGFSSHEAFTRSFKEAYGITPSEYRKHPKPLVLRTKIYPFDRYFLGLDEIGMMKSTASIKVYVISIPAHRFLHIKNYDSNGYWDFWRKQQGKPGQDQETICGLLDSIKGKLDDAGGSEANSKGGQIMAYINDPAGRLCDWGFLRTECWGVRLPFDYTEDIPAQLCITDIPEADYIVFEHGPFNYEQENRSIEKKIETAMETFDYTATDYRLDTSSGRIMYFYYHPEQYFKYIRPVQRVDKADPAIAKHGKG